MRLASSWHFLPHFSLEQTSLSFVFFPIMQQVNKQGCSLRKEAPSWSYLQITGVGTFYVHLFDRQIERGSQGQQIIISSHYWPFYRFIWIFRVESSQLQLTFILFPMKTISCYCCTEITGFCTVIDINFQRRLM